MTDNEHEALFITVCVVWFGFLALVSPLVVVLCLALAFACVLVYRSTLALLNALDMYKEKKQ